MTPRIVRVGGMSRDRLLAALPDGGIELNDLARALIDHRDFQTSAEVREIAIAEVSVADLGFPDGAPFAQIEAAAVSRGLELCPLELAPHLRLQYLDQPEGASGFPAMPRAAPPGSLTVASPVAAGDEERPAGFYLRQIDGVLWLRGYRASADHVWNPGDRFVFRAPRFHGVSAP